MKPKIDDKRCGASNTSGCKAMLACPVDAIRYIEVEEPILDRTVNCSSSSASGDSCGCSCGCNGSPYGRIVIDYDKCIECGVCADECCGAAIDMVE